MWQIANMSFREIKVESEVVSTFVGKVLLSKDPYRLFSSWECILFESNPFICNTSSVHNWTRHVFFLQFTKHRHCRFQYLDRNRLTPRAGRVDVTRCVTCVISKFLLSASSRGHNHRKMNKHVYSLPVVVSNPYKLVSFATVVRAWHTKVRGKRGIDWQRLQVATLKSAKMESKSKNSNCSSKNFTKCSRPHNKRGSSFYSIVFITAYC